MDKSHAQEILGKRSGRATLVESTLNGPLFDIDRISNSRSETDGKPQEASDEIEASNKKEEAYCKAKTAQLWTGFRLIAAVMAVFLLAWIEIKINRNESKADPTIPRMTMFPSRWLVLTNTILVSMWWIAMCLSKIHERWERFDETQGPKLLFMRRRPPAEPPDPVENKKGQRMLADIIERERELSKGISLLDRILRREPTGCRRRLMLLALQAATLVATDIPNIDLLETKRFRNHLRRYKKEGVMMTATVKDEDRVRLRKVLEDLPQGLLAVGDSFSLIFDTGCTKTGTGYIEDFIPDTLKDFKEPIRMDGIAGGLMIKQEGRVRYEVVDDSGGVQVIETTAYYIPELRCRLFSPQAYFAQLHEEGLDHSEMAQMSVKRTKSIITWPHGAQMTIQYDRNTHLPQVRAYKAAVHTAAALALKGNVDDETNQNLTSAQKTLLRWHFRLGHVGFSAVRWLGRQGFLGVNGEKMAAANLEAPKCAACQFGKQGRTSTPTKHSNHDTTGSLSKEKLEPGQLVFMDQYESRQPGRAFTSMGLVSSSLQYGGGTLFYDAASAYIYCSHQVGHTVAETIESKMKFERESLSSGVTVQAYHTDNGVFTSKEFMRELGEKGQGMKLSGVSAQFQNGAAENGIKIVVRNARTMMLHAALRWPGYAERDLWPMALSHAVYLYNHTPKQDSGVAPIEVFTRTKSMYGALQSAHPWGCPVYVLTPKLRDGQKIPKWEPRSRRGQYVGASPMHASTVGLVRNLQTGSITPQFHMVYDDFFETVHSDEDQEPKEWLELVTLNRFQSDIDSDDYIPDLPDEWLNPQERQEREAAPPAAGPPQPEVPPDIGGQRHSTRTRRKPTRYAVTSDEHKKSIANLCWTGAQSLVRCAVGQESDYRYLLALLTDVDTGGLDGLHPGIIQFPSALKASRTHDPDTPTYTEAMNGMHREEFMEAMTNEIKELEDHKTWTTVQKSSLPKHVRVLPSTWAYRIKRYPDGRHRKFKARFCVRGDRQIEGVDYTEKYSPVVSWSTVRMMMCLSASQGLQTKQVDFSNAFVQAELSDDEHIYVAIPKGFDFGGSNEEEQVLKLRRSLYGLVQAPLYWGNHLKNALHNVGLKQSVSDPCMYIGDELIALTYVDDVLFFGKSAPMIESKIKALQERGFKLTVEDDVYAFLGVEVHHLPNGELELKQSGLIDKVLTTCGMTNCNTKETPCNQDPLGTDPNGEPVTGKFDYASAVGMLMYLCSNTRPDIQYAVHQCARFTHFPKKTHEDAITRICRYLQGTKEQGMRFKPDGELKLDCYVDADFAGLYNAEDSQDPVCVKSRTGYCLTLGSCPLIWVSKLQTEVALSTTEAEYIALSQAMRDLIPMRRLLQEAGQALQMAFSKPAILHSTVFEDNNGAISLASSPRITPRTKHIAVKYHHFRTNIGEDMGILIAKIDTDHQKADIFTKGLGATKHKALRKMLMGW